MYDSVIQMVRYVVESHFEAVEVEQESISTLEFFSTTHDRKSINRCWKEIEKRLPDKCKLLFAVLHKPGNAFWYKLIVVEV